MFIAILVLRLSSNLNIFRYAKYLSSPLEQYIKHKYIKEDSIEYREYQVNLAQVAKDANTLILLPTGLGKTTIALLIIADMLERSKKRILLMAPTRVLVHQHYEFLKKHMNIIDISIVTGEKSAEKRVDVWNNSIICATPQVVQNDLEHGIIDPNEFSLAIFDEAHRAIGDHAYVKIASLLKNARIIGLTATIPNEQAKAKEIINNLSIINIEHRDEESKDVKPYLHDTKIEYVNVELSLLLKKIREHLEQAMSSQINILKSAGLPYKGSISELIRIKDYEIVKKNRLIAKALFSTIRLYHALNIFDTQSLHAFVLFYDRLRERKGIGIDSLLKDDNFKMAYEIARGAILSGIEHPKIYKLCEIIEKEKGKILVFTSYRDNVEVLYDVLKKRGFKVGYLVGKAGEDGLKEKEQINVVEEFKDGRIDILIATRVGEEGLDISECNLVIFYDNVPSIIRFIQRKGRTGRHKAGRVIMLITKDTLDETYSVISKRKIKSAKNVIKKISKRKIIDYL
ncbi:MAG: helicase-related protein [Candidatus Nitrosocaldaceae archaeon]